MLFQPTCLADSASPPSQPWLAAVSDADGKRVKDLVKQGKFEEAVQAADKIIAANPQDSGAFVLRGVVFRTQYFVQFVNRIAEYGVAKGKALADFDKALQLDTKNALAHLERGRLHNFANPRSLDALRDYTRAIELDENPAEAYVERGFFYMQRSQQAEPDTKKALFNFTMAVEVDEKYVPARLARAALYADERLLPGALEDLNEALKAEPKNVHALLLRAQIHVGMRNTKAAHEDARQAIKLQPSAQAHRAEALIFWQEQDHAAAMKQFDLAVKADDKDAYTLLLRGRIKSVQGKLTEALDDFEAALKLDESNWQVWQSKAQVLVRNISAKRKEGKTWRDLAAEKKSATDAISAAIKALETFIQAEESAGHKTIRTDYQDEILYLRILQEYMEAVLSDSRKTTTIDQHRRQADEHLRQHPDDGDYQYLIACTYAARSLYGQGAAPTTDKPNAIDYLGRAIANGFYDVATVTTDPLLDPIRDEAGFIKLMGDD